MADALIEQFQAAAELLDVQGSREALDDAIVRLAAWMELAEEHLTDDDRAVLISLGGLLYREGLRQRTR